MKTIVWDVDDVLNAQTRVWFEEYWRPAHPDCALSYAQLAENPPHRLLGISLTEYLASLDDFRLAHGSRMEPCAQILQWFHAYGAQFRHIALTAIPLRAADISAAWVLKHFGRWIRTFCFVPSSRAGEVLPAYEADKAEFLCWLGRGELLLDDNPANVESARHAGIPAMLMPQPWNASPLTVAETLAALTELLNSPS